jgi:hypothetical protein
MSLQPHAIYPIPEDTQRVARAAFPHGNIYMGFQERRSDNVTCYIIRFMAHTGLCNATG